MNFYRLSLNQMTTARRRIAAAGRVTAAVTAATYVASLWFWFDWRWITASVAATVATVAVGWLLVDIDVEYQRRVDARRWDYTHRN